MEENLRYLEDVTVTTPPFTITRYPVDTDLYPTTPVGYRPEFVTEVTFHIPESRPTIEFQWYQVGDPDRSRATAVHWSGRTPSPSTPSSTDRPSTTASSPTRAIPSAPTF